MALVAGRVAIPPRLDSRPVPPTRSRGRAAFALPLPVAAAAGLGAGAAAHATLLVAAAVVSALVLVGRVDWAALALICGSVFDDYLALISPWAVDWLLVVLVMAWLVRRAQGPLHAHRTALAALPAAGLAVVALVAFLAHPNGVDGLEVLLRYLELPVAMVVLADVLCGPLSPRRAARAYVLACTAAAVCGLVTAALSDRHRVLGPVASADTLAFFLVAALPLVGTVRTRSERWWWWPWACFGVLLLAVIGSQSRPAFVALAAMIAVAVLTGVLALRQAGALLAVLTTGVALVIALLPVPIGQALSDPQRYSETNVAQRNDNRIAALEMTRASPVVGLGPAGFRLFHQEFRHADADPDDRGVKTAYSTALETSAELGVLGLLALYAGWALPPVTARRRWLRDRRRLTAGVLLAVDGLLVASLLESEQFVLPLWLLAAMAFALGRPEPLRRPIFGGDSLGWSSGQVGARS